MEKTEIIAKTIADMVRGHAPDPEYVARIVVSTLKERVPEGDIRTCEDFQDLHVACCPICHIFYPHFEMVVIDLPNVKAWVCHTVWLCLFPDSKVHESSPKAHMLNEMLGRETRKA